MEKKPYLIKSDGMIHDRASGERIGKVSLVRGQGWCGYLLGPEFPEDPWQQERVDTGSAGRRWSVARAVWAAHQSRRSTP